MSLNPYTSATFLKSAAKINQLPIDSGYEVAFAGRSNAGKSSALNYLTEIHNLARTSKTPGRTQLINLFSLDEERRLVDLPGYGYAQVARETKENWQRTLASYLDTRECLRGLILLMDCRHPLKDLDCLVIEMAALRVLPVHILLTKADKLSRSEVKNTLLTVRRKLAATPGEISIQAFSTLKKEGKEALIERLNEWFQM